MCTQCGEEEGCFLLLFEKFIPEISKIAWRDPQVICSSCMIRWKAAPTLFEDRPKIWSFAQLGGLSKEKFGWLLSKKGKESNHLATSHWHDKLWQIRQLTHGRVQRWVETS